MKRFLSIDWDYFVDATAEERNLMFPEGGTENRPPEILKYIWDRYYSYYSSRAISSALGTTKSLRDIGVNTYYVPVCEALLHNVGHQVWAYDSHAPLYLAITSIIKDSKEPFEVVNIDFHHDLYNYFTDGERLNCGNWATLLREQYPSMKYVWVGHHDSDVISFGEEIPVRRMTREIIKDIPNFQYVFICRSGVWSPPHLDPLFASMLSCAMSHNKCEVEKYLSVPREF